MHPILSPERGSRRILSSLDDENADADRKLPKVISPTDPCSAWTAKANKRVQFGYGLNYMIDTEHAVIIDVEATPARTFDEVAATRTMIDRTERAFGLRPQRLAADTAYGTGRLIAWLLDRAIAPHIPVWERYATLQLPGALHVNSAQTYEAAALAGLGLIRLRSWGLADT